MLVYEETANKLHLELSRIEKAAILFMSTRLSRIPRADHA